jgi:transcriptional regulator with XRE-family HTH domain
VTARRSPTVQRRRLGIELRRLRERAGLTIGQVASRLDCSDSKVSRIETGQVSATPRDVREMLELYGVDPGQQETLVQVAGQARQRGWWEAYGDALAMPLAGLDTEADQIHQYETMLVPGLLQTTDYARAVLRGLRPELLRRQIERWVDFRMARQALLARDPPPEFSVVVEECVLTRPVGGRSVMAEQLRHLAGTAGSRGLTLQVLPLAVGEHVGMNGPFTVYRFDDWEVPDVVYLEHTRGDLYLERPEQVEPYSLAFDRLRALALSSEESVAFIASTASALETAR